MLLQGITQLGSRAAVNDIAPSPLLAEVAHRLKQRGEGPSMKGVQQLQLASSAGKVRDGREATAGWGDGVSAGKGGGGRQGVVCLPCCCCLCWAAVLGDISSCSTLPHSKQQPNSLFVCNKRPHLLSLIVTLCPCR